MDAQMIAELNEIEPLDCELQWIAHASGESHIYQLKEKGERPTVWSMIQSYCHPIAEAVAERMKVTEEDRKLSFNEANNIGFEALKKIDPDQKLGLYERINLIASVVAKEAKFRAENPKVYVVETIYYMDFNAGFCNPYKL